VKPRAACGIALLWLLATASALGAVPGLALEWLAPAGCPTQQQVEQAVLQGRLDRRAAPGREVSAKVIVERHTGGTFRAELTTSAPEGRGVRLLQGESCDAIASASAVVLALALDPPAEPAPPPEPAPEAPTPALTTAPQPRPWLGYAHVFGGGVLRALPRPSPSFGLGVGMRHGAWDLELLGSLSTAQTVAMSTPPGASATLSMLRAQVLGCYAPVLSNSTALVVCAGLLLERMAGDSAGVSNPAQNSIVLLSPQLGLRSRIRVTSRVELGLGVTGAARPTQPRFVIGGVGQVHEMPVFEGMLDAGLLIGF
jgi:hypothetical protein